MKIRSLVRLVILLNVFGFFCSEAQTLNYSKNNLAIEVTYINPCTTSSSNGSITFKLIGSASGRAILVLITGPKTTEFPEFELNLTDKSTYTYVPGSPQSGTYDFVIRDPVNTDDFINSLVPSISGIDLQPPPPINFPLSNQVFVPVSCKGLADGSVTVSASGGNGTFTYSIDNANSFQSTDVFSNLSAGNYKIIAKDKIGCQGEAVLSITEPDPITTTSTPNPVSCNGSSDGQISVTATGGNGNYEYSTDNGVTFLTTALIKNLTPGSYTILVKDQKNCRSAGQTAIVTEPSPITISTSTTAVTKCDPGNDGTLTALAAGGNGNFTYSIDESSFQNSSTFTGLKGGLYVVTAKDSKGCSEFVSATIDVPAGPLFAFTIQDLKCFNDKSGTISINGFGGTSPLQYSSNGGVSFEASGNFSNLSAGTYKLVVKDSKNCTFSINTALFQPSEIIPTPVTSPVLCNGQANGSITISATGGNGNFVFSNDNGTTFRSSGVFNNLPAATYRVIVKDAKDCRSTALPVTLADPPPIQINSNIRDASCSKNDGVIQLGVSGGTNPLRFNFNNTPLNALPSSGFFTGLNVGNYTFRVTDARGCTKQNSFAVSFPGDISATAIATPPDCTGNGNNGFISVDIASTGNFQAGLSFNPSAAPSSFINVTSGKFTFNELKNGTYAVTVKSNTLCQIVIPVTISGGPDQVNFSSEVVEKKCAEDRSFVRLSSFTGNQSLGYTAEIYSGNNLYKSEFIPVVSATTQPVEIEIPDKGEYQLRLSQDQSALTPCTTPITTAFVSFSLDAPGGLLDIAQVEKKISYPDLPTGLLTGIITESQEEPYQTRLELIDPLEEGQRYESDFEVLQRADGNSAFQFRYSKLFAGAYLLTLKDAFGCEKEYPITIDFDPKLFIPNIFTPDGDGINEEFFIRNLPPNSKLDITDSWGQKIYSSSNYQNDWKAEDTPNGIYYYNLMIGNKNYSGWVEVLNGK